MCGMLGLGSPLYRRLKTLRFVLPFVAFLPILAFEAYEHFSPWSTGMHVLAPNRSFLVEFAFFGVVGPVVVWLTLSWTAQRVRERDEAEAHLRSLTEVSHRVIVAADIEELVDIALRMPARVADHVATSVILQGHPHGRWRLAGTHGLREEQHAALEACMVAAGAGLRCGECASLASAERQSCPLLSRMPADLTPAFASVICLPLSTESPPHALLNVYLPGGAGLTDTARQALESMASELAVAMDRARLQARALQMAYQIDQTVRGWDGLDASVNHILATMATVLRADAGAVYLEPRENGRSAPIAIAVWPEGEPHPHLMDLARRTLAGGNGSAAAEVDRQPQVVSVPLVADGITMGALMLTSRRPLAAPEMALLNVAAGTVALMIRNHQLYAELESLAVLEERGRLAREVHDGVAQALGSLNFKIQEIDRLLVRERWDSARQAFSELREGVQKAYAEVRQTIQDLRWSLEEGQGLAECLQDCVAAFANRTGLPASLTVDGQPELAPQAEVQLFRIVQEALMNVHRHAYARHVWVRLVARPDGTTLEVEDDGVGLPAEFAESGPALERFGLRIMEERAASIGGRLFLRSAPWEGTKLQIVVPAVDARSRSKAGNGLN